MEISAIIVLDISTFMMFFLELRLPALIVSTAGAAFRLAGLMSSGNLFPTLSFMVLLGMFVLPPVLWQMQSLNLKGMVLSPHLHSFLLFFFIFFNFSSHLSPLIPMQVLGNRGA